MKSADEVMAWFANAKGEPAPEYIRNEIGIAHKAMEVRSRKRFKEWNGGDDPFPISDEIPY